MTERPEPLVRAVGVRDTHLLRDAVHVLALALCDDPGWRHVLPDDHARYLALCGVLGIAARDAVRYGAVLVTTDDGRVTGAAITFGPGAYPPTFARRLRALPAKAMLALRLPRHSGAVATFTRGLEATFPADAPGYVWAIGVHPQAQRRGLGRALLAPLLALPIPWYVETSAPHNLDYYRTLGFSMLDGEPATIAPGGPTLWRLCRFR